MSQVDEFHYHNATLDNGDTATVPYPTSQADCPTCPPPPVSYPGGVQWAIKINSGGEYVSDGDDPLLLELAAEVMQLREKLIDARMQLRDRIEAEYFESGSDTPIHEYLGVTAESLSRYRANPREFMRQKLFGGES